MSEFEKTILYFQESSEGDWRVAKKLFDDKEFGYCLFFCHLALEKLLKAIVVMQTDAPVEYTHSLLRLAELAKMDLTVDQIENLKTITKFNIAGRYEDEKWEFRKLATHDYAEKYIAVTEELILWLKNNYLKK
jgi:HEPN domain-containing protein